MGSEAERFYLPTCSFSWRLRNISLCNTVKGVMEENVCFLMASCHDYQLLPILGEPVQNKLTSNPQGSFSSWRVTFGRYVVAVADLQGHKYKWRLIDCLWICQFPQYFGFRKFFFIHSVVGNEKTSQARTCLQMLLPFMQSSSRRTDSSS